MKISFIAAVALSLLLDFLLLSQITGTALRWLTLVQVIISIVALLTLRKRDYLLVFYAESELKKDIPIAREIADELVIQAGIVCWIIPGFIIHLAGSLLFVKTFRDKILDYFFYDAI